jgi:hypothetical protein
MRRAAAVVSLGVTFAATMAGVVTASQHERPSPATAPASPKRCIELPEAIRKALLRNAEQLGPAITVSWTSQAHASMPVPELAKALKIGESWADERANGRMTMRCAWQDGKYVTSYRELPWPTKAEPSYYQVHTSFDGEDLFMLCNDVDAEGKDIPLEPGVMHVGLSIQRLADEPSEGDGAYAYIWYFESAGIRLPARIDELQKRLPVRSEVLVLLDQGAQLTDLADVDLDGKKTTRVRIVLDNQDRRRAEKIDLEKYAEMLQRMSAESEEGQHDLIEAIKRQRQLPEQLIHLFWLDPELNYAVRRHQQQYEPDTVLSRVECTDFRRVAGRDLYLPYKITLNNHTADRDPGAHFKEPLVTQVLELTDLKVEPLADTDFILECKVPGQTIIDRRDRDHVMQFIVDENGQRRALP